MTIGILGIDVARNTFELHSADDAGEAIHKKRLARRELAAHVVGANKRLQTILRDFKWPWIRPKPHRIKRYEGSRAQLILVPEASAHHVVAES